MVKLRCQDCGSIVEGSKKDVDTKECECGGNIAVLNSEDDTYEPNNCQHCKKDIGNNDIFSCDECCDDNLCENCLVPLENICICKKCVDKVYPRKVETRIEYKEKIIEKPVNVYLDKEGTPINTTYDPNKKTEFD